MGPFSVVSDLQLSMAVLCRGQKCQLYAKFYDIKELPPPTPEKVFVEIMRNNHQACTDLTFATGSDATATVSHCFALSCVVVCPSGPVAVEATVCHSRRLDIVWPCGWQGRV